MKKVDFSETIAACDFNLDRFRQLIELMTVCVHRPVTFLARLHEVQNSYCSHPGRTRAFMFPFPFHFVKVFLEVYILTTSCQKAFILGPLVPYRVSFHSMTSDPNVHAGGGARGQNLVHLQKLGFLC